MNMAGDDSSSSKDPWDVVVFENDEAEEDLELESNDETGMVRFLPSSTETRTSMSFDHVGDSLSSSLSSSSGSVDSKHSFTNSDVQEVTPAQKPMAKIINKNIEEEEDRIEKDHTNTNDDDEEDPMQHDDNGRLRNYARPTNAGVAWQRLCDDDDDDDEGSFVVANESDSSFSSVSHASDWSEALLGSKDLEEKQPSSSSSSSSSLGSKRRKLNAAGVVTIAVPAALTKLDLWKDSSSSSMSPPTFTTRIYQFLSAWRLDSAHCMDQLKDVMATWESEALEPDEDMIDLMKQADELVSLHTQFCSKLKTVTAKAPPVGGSKSDNVLTDPCHYQRIDPQDLNTPFAATEGYDVVKLFSRSQHVKDTEAGDGAKRAPDHGGSVRVLVGLDYDNQSSFRTCTDSWLVVMKKSLQEKSVGDGKDQERSSSSSDARQVAAGSGHNSHSLFSEPVDPLSILADALAHFRLDASRQSHTTIVASHPAGVQNEELQSQGLRCCIPLPIHKESTRPGIEAGDGCKDGFNNNQASKSNEEAANTENYPGEPAVAASASKEDAPLQHQTNIELPESNACSNSGKRKLPNRVPVPEVSSGKLVCITSNPIRHGYVRRWRELIMSFAEKKDEFPTWSDDICRMIREQLAVEQLTQFVVNLDLNGYLSENSYDTSRLYLATDEEIVQCTKRAFMGYRELPNRVPVLYDDLNQNVVCLTSNNQFHTAERRWRELIFSYAENKEEFPTWSDDICRMVREQLAGERITKFVVALDTKGEPSLHYHYTSRRYLATDKEITDFTRKAFMECRQSSRVPVLPELCNQTTISLTGESRLFGAGRRWNELIISYAENKHEFPTWSDDICRMIREQLVLQKITHRFTVTLDAKGNVSEHYLDASRLYLATDEEVVARTKRAFMEYRKFPHRVPVLPDVWNENSVVLTGDTRVIGAGRKWRELVMSYAEKKAEFPTWSDAICVSIREQLACEKRIRFVVTLDTHGNLSEKPKDMVRLYSATDEEVVDYTKRVFMECRQLPNRVPVLPDFLHGASVCLTIDTRNVGAGKRWRELIMTYAQKKEEFPVWSDAICVSIREQLARERLNRFVVNLDLKGELSEVYTDAKRLYVATDEEVLWCTKRIFLQCRQLPNRIPALM